MTNVISSHITKLVVVILITIFVVASQDITDNSDVGYRIGKVKGYKKLRQFAKSALYEVQCDELDDGRPIKLLDLHGSHFDAGYAYTKLMAKQINFSYKTFMHSALGNEAEIKLIQLFLDWQYQSFVQKQIPFQFLEELRGIDKGAREEHYPLLGRYFKRTLVISSFPGALQHDIASILADQFWKKVIGIKNEKHESFIQDEILKITQTLMKFIKKVGVHCSFFATWGKRTINQKLYSMRNLDWLENTGVNQNKLITVWKIDSTIPHLTLGYPGILGALTGMSRAGLTVHEAGLSNHHSTELGFQWTLRMRYIMMHASNLAQVKKIWDSTNNTLGMNFMVASSSDNIPFGYPALAMETMRGYTAYFHDNDPRENATQFYDPKTKKQYTAGYGMPNALFRTNHGYDPTIVKHLRNSQISENDDSMIRYKVMKNAFHYYEKNQQKMGPAEAVNITAILGDKGSEKFLTCQDNFKGINVISVTYDPQQLVMWAAFEYGFEKTFRSACCGVYVEMDMRKWLI